MKNDNSLVIFEEITNETLSEICSKKVILPKDYAKTFHKIAKKKDVDIEHDEKSILESLSEKTLGKANNLMQDAQVNLEKLGICAQEAHSAIIAKDEIQIKTVSQTVISLKKEILKLRDEVYKDNLTRLYNRKWIYDNLLEKETCFAEDGVLAFIDIDRFKNINDTFGHAVGDKVLEHISYSFKLNMKVQMDTGKVHIIRYAGDEFLIFSSLKTFLLQEKLLEIQKDFASKKFKLNNNIFDISYSFGACEFKSGDAFLEVLKKADEAMYQNKMR